MKEIPKKAYEMTNTVFEEKMKLLFEIDENIKYENDFEQKKKSAQKKKIAIAYDEDGWAYCNIAKQIKENLSDEFEIDIFPKHIYGDNVVKLILLAQQYDLVHCLWRGVLSSLDYEYVRGYIYNMGMTFEEFMDKYYTKTNFTTSVYDHMFLEGEGFANTESFIKYCRNYTVSSSLLKDIYNNLNISKKPMAVISDGVNIEKFKPINIERFKPENINNRKIVIGWVGNSEFTDSEGDSDLKGLRKIINPALEELINEGYPIELKFADRKIGYIPHDEMPNYYSQIDVYICASKTEGTPNPVLESMAMGVPIISTNVGIVNDAFGEKQKKYILKERSKETLKSALKELIDNRSQFEELSKENLEQIKNWTWKEKCKQFREFFKKNLD